MFYYNFASSFLKNDANKTALNNLIADISTEPWLWHNDFCITKGSKVWTNFNDETEFYHNRQVMEEADNRIICHMKDMMNRGLSSVCVRIADTDVIVILLAFMKQFLDWNKDVQLTVDFGSGKHRRPISINDAYNQLGESTCLGLLFFHAFTGSDATSLFYKLPKNTWFTVLKQHPKMDEMTEAFQELSWLPSEQTVARCMSAIAAFVSYAYVKMEVCVNELRYEIFVSSSSNELRDIPPSLDALSLHVCRSAFQAGWIWGNSVSQAACPSAS